MGRHKMLSNVPGMLGRVHTLSRLGLTPRKLHQDMAVERSVPYNEVTPEEPRPILSVSTSNLTKMRGEIHRHLDRYCLSTTKDLKDMAKYYFDGEGKSVRPVMAMLMANAINTHLGLDDEDAVRDKQRQIGMICEMWHTSSLLHDDVIDQATTRRGKMSVNIRWDASRSVLTGNYILGVSTILLAQTGNPQVVLCMSQILSDLVNGEFQQMGSRSNQDDRFQLYIDKTFNKTASLMANSCKSVAILATDDKIVQDMAYNYGQNIGIAFQLVDDLLDFVASADQLGKPAGADLLLGLATAPVLFASKQFSHLNNLIERRFSRPGDVEEAFDLVYQSEGLEQTKLLATKYSKAALSSIQGMEESIYKQELEELASKIINRCK